MCFNTVLLHLVISNNLAGEFGDVDTSREKEAEIVKQKLLSQAVSIIFQHSL